MPYSVTIDLHGQTVESAGKLLTQRLKQLSDEVREVTVLHGFHGGTALRDMVRRYKNPRIERKYSDLIKAKRYLLLFQKAKRKVKCNVYRF